MKRLAWLLGLALLLTGCGGGGSGGGGGAAPASPAVASAPAESPSPTVAPVATAGVLVAVAVHSEDPYHPETPDFLADPEAYRRFRTGLLEFAAEMQDRGLAWQFESDYNFLNGVLEYEVNHPDPALLAETGGQNVVAWLSTQRGVAMDPHSHENDGYNYADIAYLLTLVGVQPTGVVGGHIYDPAEPTYQDWPRFLGPLRGNRHPEYSWQATMLMGAGTPQHVDDPLATGMWRPASPDDYFTDSPATPLVAFGAWDNQVGHVEELARWVQGGLLGADHAWTATLVLPHHSLTRPGYLRDVVAPQLDTLQRLRDQGLVQVVQFEQALATWRTRYAQAGAVFPAGDDFLSFSLNVQDFSYPELSIALLERALDLHEDLRVPVDVFLTTTQVDLFEAMAPDLLERLRTSPVARVSYHVRAPKPYANSYDWAAMGSLPLDRQQDLVREYETHGLDLVTGQPTAASGGYAKLAGLLEAAPWILGAGEPTLADAVLPVFAGMGARMVVQHGFTVNLGDARSGLWIRPEHLDLRLFESQYEGQDPGAILDGALTAARSSAGGRTPWFVGVKMHDNDFFAVESAWLTVYREAGRFMPPWDPTARAALLEPARADEMWRRYEAVVREADRRRGRLNLVFAPMIVQLAEWRGAGPP